VSWPRPARSPASRPTLSAFATSTWLSARPGWASTARMAARPTLPVPHTAVRMALGSAVGAVVASVTPGRYPPAGSADLLLAEPPAVGELRLQVVAVHHRDEIDRDLLRARFLALAV